MSNSCMHLSTCCHVKPAMLCLAVKFRAVSSLPVVLLAAAIVLSVAPLAHAVVIDGESSGFGLSANVTLGGAPLFSICPRAPGSSPLSPASRPPRSRHRCSSTPVKACY